MDKYEYERLVHNGDEENATKKKAIMPAPIDLMDPIIGVGRDNRSGAFPALSLCGTGTVFRVAWSRKKLPSHLTDVSVL